MPWSLIFAPSPIPLIVLKESFMRVIRFALPMFLLSTWVSAQVLAPEEILDPGLRELQQKYRGELKQIAAAAAQHEFPYHFYFSRTLDLSEIQQQQSDQRSIQFDHFRDQTV